MTIFLGHAIFYAIQKTYPQQKNYMSQSDPEQQLAQAHRELNVLYEVSAAMRTTLELEHILYIILTGVTSHSGLGYNRAILFLMNPKTNTLECEMVIGPESGEHANKIWSYIENQRPQIDDLIREDKVETTISDSALLKRLKALKFPLDSQNKLLLVDAYHRGTPWHLTKESLLQYDHDPLLQNFQSNEFLIMPLRAKGKINGLIVADNFYTQKPISTEDIRIFSLLAGHASLAIENSRLYEMTVEKSHTDSLTNLWNHGYFQEKLNKEIILTQKANQPLSLMMVDIDHFKELNDTYGHQNGDWILKNIAQILHESSRESDYICRYGGEEFAIILCHTDKKESFQIAERLRQKIEEYIFKVPSLPQDLRLTVSIGLASFPEDTQTKEELIANADKSMYIAKFSGRNKTCLTEPLNN